ncbi:MAG: DUF6503 family protein [Bacteroidota bacterium]
MKVITLATLVFFLLTGVEMKQTSSPAADYPAALQKVFEAHGGIDAWKSYGALTFGIEKENGVEMNYVNLWDRRDRIDGHNFNMGFDGKQVWLKAGEDYKGNAVFYHNLMFYFYAMPFVLGDDGINYSETEPLEFEGKSYPGVKISYNQGVGSSDLDEYILYYDPETYQMAWLGYTATYYTKKRKKEFSKIRYDNWTKVGDIVLPQSISWFKVEDGKLIEPRNTVTFTDLKLTKERHPNSTFEMPEGAKVAE